ncbi:hypothetical protein [Nocardia sp. NPDC005998]
MGVPAANRSWYAISVIVTVPWVRSVITLFGEQGGVVVRNSAAP